VVWSTGPVAGNVARCKATLFSRARQILWARVRERPREPIRFALHDHRAGAELASFNDLHRAMCPTADRVVAVAETFGRVLNLDPLSG